MARKSNTNDNALVHLYEREDGKYVRFYLMYTLPGKGRVKELLKDLPKVARSDRYFNESRAKAQSLQWARTEEIRRGALGLNAPKGVMLHEWFNIVAERVKRRERKDLNRNTWSRAIEYTGRIIQDWRNLQVTDVDKETAIDFIDYIQHGYKTIGGKSIAAKTAAKKVSVFSYVMNEAVRDGLVPFNPFGLLNRGEKVHVPPTQRAFLTEGELQRLVATPCKSEETKRIYLFMCFCGLRISDASGLRWSDIEKDGDHWWIQIRMQKTQEPLYLPLSNITRQFLPDKGESEYVFANIPKEQTMNRYLKEWAKAAGIDKHLTLHTARHTFATLMLTKGSDIYTVSKLLGHSSVTTTQIYAKIIDKKKAAAVDLLNSTL